MNVAELVFIGIKGSVVALHRDTGAIVWALHLKGSDFVNVMLDNGRVFATTYGEVFCVDAATGQGLWQNGLKGYGLGLASIAVENNLLNGLNLALAEKHRRQQQAQQHAAG